MVTESKTKLNSSNLPIQSEYNLFPFYLFTGFPGKVVALLGELSWQFWISCSLPSLSYHTSAAVLIPLSDLLGYQMLAQVSVPANTGHAELLSGCWVSPDCGSLPLLRLPGFYSVAWISCCTTSFVSKRARKLLEHTCARNLFKEWGTFVHHVGLILIYLSISLLCLWFLMLTMQGSISWAE